MNIEAYNLDSLRKLVRALQAENKELRELLEKAEIPYSNSELFMDTPVRKEEFDLDQGGRITQQFIDKKLAVRFFSMFWGREDVFAKRAKNGNYYPQCDNRWNNAICPKQKGEKTYCGDCEYACWTELTPEILMNHLLGYREDGADVIGVYPLLADGTCRFLVFDFDNHEKDAAETDFANEDEMWHDEVDALRLICKQNGIDALVERSRSGKGAHVWIFFQKPIPASLARNFGFLLLDKGATTIIALDEDDVVAIASRNLIDDTGLFLKDRILDSKSKSIPDTNTTALTTIISYYECNKELLWLYVKDIDVRGLDGELIRGRKKINEYIRHRPSETVITEFTRECYEFWTLIMSCCKGLNEYADGTVGKYRDREGGHIFFRPVAILPFAKVVVRIREKTGMGYEEIFNSFPEELLWIQHKLWRRILWDGIQKKMIMGHSKLVELILLYVYDPQLLSEAEKVKVINGLRSVWDMQEGEDVIEILNEIIELK